MPDHDPAFDDAVREIANLLATVYLRLRLPVEDWVSSTFSTAT